MYWHELNPWNLIGKLLDIFGCAPAANWPIEHHLKEVVRGCGKQVARTNQISRHIPQILMPYLKLLMTSVKLSRSEYFEF